MGFLSKVLKLCTKLDTSWLTIGLIYRFLELDSSKDEYFYTFSLPVESFLHTGQFSSVVQSCPPLCNPMDCSTPGFPVHHQLPELAQIMSIKFVMPSNRLILCHPLLLLPSVFFSIRVFSNLSVLHIRWPKYWSFSFRISLYNEYSGLVSFRIDWLDLLAVQGTLKGLLQHHSSKASIHQHLAFFFFFRHLAFFMVQLSHWAKRCISKYDVERNLISGNSKMVTHQFPINKTRDKLHLFPFMAASNNAAINIPVINDSLLFPQTVPSRILYTFPPLDLERFAFSLPYPNHSRPHK